MKRNESNTTSGLLRRVGSIGKRLFATLLVTGALSIGLHSAANAQWMQGTSPQDVDLQFPTVSHVGIGVNPATFVFAASDMLYVLGNAHLVGTTTQDGIHNQNGNLNLNPVGTARTMFYFSDNATDYSSFTNGSSATTNAYLWPANTPALNDVLTWTAGGQLKWLVPAGGIGGGGTPNFIPRFTPTGVLLGNSIIQDLSTAGSGVVVGVPGIVTPDLFQVMGNARVGGIFGAPVLVPPTFGSPIIFGGVPGNFPPAANSENTDLTQLVRRNNAFDNSEVDLSVGDNPEGIIDATGTNVPDKFLIGATPTAGGIGITGVYKPMFSFSTLGLLSIGSAVANLNGLDVGWNAIGGAVPPPNSASVAVGSLYAGLVAAPKNGAIIQGNVGIGNTFGGGLPINRLEITGGIAATGGVRLTNLAGGATVGATYPAVLSVNATGDVVLVPAGGGGVTGLGTASQLAVWNGTTSLTNSILFDNGSKIGINTTTPSSSFSFQFNPGATPVAQTVGVERTNVATAPGTPLTITSGAALSGGTNLNGGDLTLIGGVSTGLGLSNIIFQLPPKGSTGITDNTVETAMFLAPKLSSTQSARLGIGKYSGTTPTYDLSFQNSGSKTIGIETLTSGTGKKLTIQAGGTSSGSGGDLYLSAGAGTSGGSHVAIQAVNGSTLNTYLYVDGPSGFIGVNNGTSTPGYTVDVNGDIHASGQLIVDGNVTFNASGTVAGTWTVSDARLKKNIVPLTGSLAQITQLRGVEYDFRNGEIPGIKLPTEHQIGFLAQEVEKIIPDAVRIGSNGYRAINYNFVVPLLTEAVKEEQNEITQNATDLQNANRSIVVLTAKVDQLEAQVEQLLSRTGSQLEGNTIGVLFFQNNPNPFSDLTTISFVIPETITKAELVVVNARSNAEVLRVPITTRGPGSIEVSANSLASGQYLYSIVADGQQAPAKKMTVLK
jgi:hypothetical protein